MAAVVLITGCSVGGIGYTMCTEFASRGCKVYATARNVAKMKGLETYSNIELMALDVTDNANVVQVIESVAQKEGRIDILINNAGLACFGPILEVPLEQISDVNHPEDQRNRVPSKFDILPGDSERRVVDERGLMMPATVRVDEIWTAGARKHGLCAYIAWRSKQSG